MLLSPEVEQENKKKTTDNNTVVGKYMVGKKKKSDTVGRLGKQKNSEKKSIIQTTLVYLEDKLTFCNTPTKANSPQHKKEGSSKKGTGRVTKKISNISNNYPIRRPIDYDQNDRQTRPNSILSYFQSVTSNLSNE